MTEQYYTQKKTASVSNFTPGENGEGDGKRERERRERARTEHVWEKDIEKHSERERGSSVRTREAISLSLFIQCGPDTESELIIRAEWRELHASCAPLRHLLRLLPLSQSEIRAPGWLPVQKVSSLPFLTCLVCRALRPPSLKERARRKPSSRPEEWEIIQQKTQQSLLPPLPPSILPSLFSPSSNKPEAAEATDSTRERRTSAKDSSMRSQTGPWHESWTSWSI